MNNMENAIPKKSKVCIKDFEVIKRIGEGSYAKVALVNHKATNIPYALKILKKKSVKRKGQLKHLKTEREVLININHPFVVKLGYSFQSEKKLFFAMEFCPGGELFNLLTKRGKLTEEQAIFYVSQIVLVIEHLHSKDIIYRDLKPENVLIDAEGYIRVADFGLSKSDVTEDNAAFSLCGTPEYLAPEIVWKTGHGKPVDWWCVGCILYELLTGQPPFYSKSQGRLFQKIKSKPVTLTKKMSPECIDLLSRLFQKDPSKRLGTQHGAKEIKNHPWFEGIQWDKLLKKELGAPFIPLLASDTDTSHFTEEYTQVQKSKGKDNTYCMKVGGTFQGNYSTQHCIMFISIIDFTYIAPSKVEYTESQESSFKKQRVK